MRALIVCLVLACGLATPTGRAEDIHEIYELIQDGKWREASELLATYEGAPTNGSLLFFQALLERSANRSSGLLQAALERGADERYHQEIYFRLAQYFLQKNNTAEVKRLISEYRERWERGKYRVSMSRMEILTHEMDGDRSTALTLIEQYQQTYSGGNAREWGKIDLARILMGLEGDPAGVSQLEDAISDRSDIMVPQAMYLLAAHALSRKRAEDAMRYYHLLKESYPDAVGLDLVARDLGDAPAKLPEVKHEDIRRAPVPTAKETGRYTIQVGAYSSERTAQAQIQRLRGERHEWFLDKRNQDGRTLWIVYLGDFRDRRQAEQVKKKLEEKYGESYQVVSR